MNECPAVREDETTGLLVIDWPRPRPYDFMMSSEALEALVSLVNIERAVAADISAAAEAVLADAAEDAAD